jgi:hypothetical protein
MPSQDVRVSTTDSIPGVSREIAWSSLAWSGEKPNARDAFLGLQKWAHDNGFEAVVGLRFAVMPSVRSQGGGSVASVYTSATWTAYGTCIRYK